VRAATRAHSVPKFYLEGFVAPESESASDPFVWIGILQTGELKRRSPKNISITPGLYDGPGGFEDVDASIEKHLAKIESAAASAIRKFVAGKPGEDVSATSEIWRFLSWQAARTPAWLELVEDWIYDWDPDAATKVVEPPPEGIDYIRNRTRKHCVENPDTGERREVAGLAELAVYRKRGWKWVLSSVDKLELIHMQAWYFQVRHFRRLCWVRLNAPDDGWFITSDRGVAWLVDGYVDAPPAALRHPKAQVVAPLTRKVVLVGSNQTDALRVTPRDVNRFTACVASNWIVGPTREVVEQAIRDRVAASKS
jgi:uncharacterized protein DUF4238